MLHIVWIFVVIALLKCEDVTLMHGLESPTVSRHCGDVAQINMALLVSHLLGIQINGLWYNCLNVLIESNI